MKIGVSCAPEYWTTLAELGYDYAEGYFAGVTLSDGEGFDRIIRMQKDAGISVEVFNGFFAPKFMLYEKSASEMLAQVRDYAEKGFDRVKRLGARIAVIGSGKSRSVPSDMTREEAEARFVACLDTLGELAQDYEMSLAIEPLRFAETNFIHTVGEGCEISRRVGRKNVGTMIDFFHSHSNGEPLDCLKNVGDSLLHAHIARLNPDRKVPTEADLDDCRTLAGALDKIGYRERISLEAVFSSDVKDDIRRAYDAMRIFRDV